MSDGVAAKIATGILVFMGRKKWGLSAAIFPFIVRRLGPLGALRWASKNIPKYEVALAELGPVHGNLAFTLASLLNGCAYCVYAHGRAFQLHFFKETGRVFPLEENELVDMRALTDLEIGQRLEVALKQANMPQELGLLERLMELKFRGAQAKNKEDEHLLHAIQMYDVLNYCAISGEVEIDDVHDAIYRDEETKARYAEARLSAAKVTDRAKPARADA